MINPDHYIAGYVQVVIIKRETRDVLNMYVSERHTISNLCTAKYAFKSCTLAKLWAEMVFRFE